jgi:hypothetical protein
MDQLTTLTYRVANVLAKKMPNEDMANAVKFGAGELVELSAAVARYTEAQHIFADKQVLERLHVDVVDEIADVVICLLSVLCHVPPMPSLAERLSLKLGTLETSDFVEVAPGWYRRVKTGDD